MKAIDLLNNYQFRALDFNESFERLDDRVVDLRKKIRNSRDGAQRFDAVLVNNLVLGFRSQWGTENNFQAISKEVLKRIDLIICHNDPQGKILYDKNFCFQLFQYLEDNSKYSLAKKVFQEILSDYDTEFEFFYQYLDILFSFLKTGERNSIKRYADVVEKYRLLENNASKKIAQIIISRDVGIDDIKQELKLYGDFASKGFGEAIVRAYSQHVEASLMSKGYSVLDQYLDFIVEDKYLITPKLKKEIFHSLLKPFISDDPDENIKSIILKFTDKFLGDPRAKNEKWFAIDADAKQVILRWKVGLTLRAFFGIIEYAAQTDPDADRMWRYRKIFWNAYLEDKQIVEAWVLLGSVARANRHSFLEEGVEYGYLGSGVQRNHNAILMKIGGLTLCEWSHSGKIRIWNEGNPNAPELYRSSYDKDELTRNPDFETAHVGADRSSWQDKLHNEIRKKTNIKVNKGKYFSK